MTSDQIERRTNGHVYFDPNARVAEVQPQRTLNRYIMPAILIVTALFIVRRLNRGNVI